MLIRVDSAIDSDVPCAVRYYPLHLLAFGGFPVIVSVGDLSWFTCLLLYRQLTQACSEFICRS